MLQRKVLSRFLGLMRSRHTSHSNVASHKAGTCFAIHSCGPGCPKGFGLFKRTSRRPNAPSPNLTQRSMHVNKALKTGLLAAAMSLSIPYAAFADDAAPPAPTSWFPGTFTGNVALTNDYIFRGVTQSNHNPAVQGGFDWDTGAGFHLGTWASTVNFAPTLGDNSDEELDLYGGYAGKIENFTYDVGGIYYWYPGSVQAFHYDYWEVYGKAGYDFGVAALGLGVNYSPENFGKTGPATYFSSSLSIPIVPELSVSLGADYYMLSHGIHDYADWNLGATFHVPTWFDIDARYYNTDAHYLGKLADDRFVVNIKRTF